MNCRTIQAKNSKQKVVENKKYDAEAYKKWVSQKAQ